MTEIGVIKDTTTKKEDESMSNSSYHRERVVHHINQAIKEMLSIGSRDQYLTNALVKLEEASFEMARKDAVAVVQGVTIVGDAEI